MKSKYTTERIIKSQKKNGNHSLKSDKVSFRVHDPSILKSDAHYGLKMKTELADFK